MKKHISIRLYYVGVNDHIRIQTNPCETVFTRFNTLVYTFNRTQTWKSEGIH